MRVYIGIPSRGRFHRVEKMNRQLWKPGHWWVPAKELAQYRAAGATKAHAQPKGRITHIRNAILEHAQERKSWCVMVDDDLNRLRAYIPGTEREFRQVSLEYTVRRVIRAMEATGSKLGGVGSNNNKMFAQRAYYVWGDLQPRGLVNGLLVIAPDNEIRFDEELYTKEDYDYCLQTVNKYGRLCRVPAIIPDFLYRSVGGGFGDQRSEAIELSSVRYLLDKWGERYLRRNNKRDGVEIKVTRWPGYVPPR